MKTDRERKDENNFEQPKMFFLKCNFLFLTCIQHYLLSCINLALTDNLND